MQGMYLVFKRMLAIFIAFLKLNSSRPAEEKMLSLARDFRYSLSGDWEAEPGMHHWFEKMPCDIGLRLAICSSISVDYSIIEMVLWSRKLRERRQAGMLASQLNEVDNFAEKVWDYYNPDSSNQEEEEEEEEEAIWAPACSAK